MPLYIKLEEDLEHIPLASQSDDSSNSCLSQMWAQAADHSATESQTPCPAKRKRLDPIQKKKTDQTPFPVKLWELVENDDVKSVTWATDGATVVINEELFTKEVLENQNAPRVFKTSCVTNFYHQLNMYGFTRQSLYSCKEGYLCYRPKETLMQMKMVRHPYFHQGKKHLLPFVTRRIRLRKRPPPASSAAAASLGLPPSPALVQAPGEEPPAGEPPSPGLGAQPPGDVEEPAGPAPSGRRGDDAVAPAPGTGLDDQTGPLADAPVPRTGEPSRATPQAPLPPWALGPNLFLSLSMAHAFVSVATAVAAVARAEGGSSLYSSSSPFLAPPGLQTCANCGHIQGSAKDPTLTAGPGERDPGQA